MAVHLFGTKSWHTSVFLATYLHRSSSIVSWSSRATIGLPQQLLIKHCRPPPIVHVTLTMRQPSRACLTGIAASSFCPFFSAPNSVVGIGITRSDMCDTREAPQHLMQSGSVHCTLCDLTPRSEPFLDVARNRQVPSEW